MRSQNAGRGGLLHAGYPHQGTVKDGIAVRQGLNAAPETRGDFSAVSATDTAEKSPRVAATANRPCLTAIPAVPVQLDLEYQIHVIHVGHKSVNGLIWS